MLSSPIALNIIENLRGVYYTRINDDSQQRNVGLIAQEVEEYLPEVVFTDKEGQQMKSIAYDNIVSLLIESIKELKLEVNNLQSILRLFQ